MLICTRCNTTRPGNSAAYKRCECGGQYAVVRDGGENDYESDVPRELDLGNNGNEQFASIRAARSPNRKAPRSIVSPAEEGMVAYD